MVLGFTENRLSKSMDDSLFETFVTSLKVDPSGAFEVYYLGHKCSEGTMEFEGYNKFYVEVPSLNLFVLLCDDTVILHHGRTLIKYVEGRVVKNVDIDELYYELEKSRVRSKLNNYNTYLDYHWYL